MPVTVCFNDGNNNNENVFDIIMDVLFGIDICINFISAYYNKHNMLVVDYKLIIINYLTG